MTWWHSTLNLILTDTCILCKQSQIQRNAHLMCHFCWAALPRNVPACPSCATPQATNELCGTCLSDPLTAGVCIAALKHEGDARQLIHTLKYGRNLRSAIPLAHTISQAVQLRYAEEALPQYLLPVPLSWRRQIMRGYNQAAWLAYRVGQQLQLPILYRAVKRQHGPAQHTLSRQARLTLRSSGFELVKPQSLRHVAIVDDVLTTGATVRALSDLLKTAGAERIDIWCATRAPLD